ncbi:MAG: hypothetical protein AAF321_07455 [Pseudomonadota bacterium]
MGAAIRHFVVVVGVTTLLAACTASVATDRPLYRDSARANTLPNVDVDPDDILDLRDD